MTEQLPKKLLSDLEKRLVGMRVCRSNRSIGSCFLLDLRSELQKLASEDESDIGLLVEDAYWKLKLGSTPPDPESVGSVRDDRDDSDANEVETILPTLVGKRITSARVQAARFWLCFNDGSRLHHMQ